MPAFLEQKLKAEYGAKSSIPYAVMNKLGALRGSRETAKGRAMQAKHDRDAATARATGAAIASVSAARRAGRLRALMGKGRVKST
ncbi:MAG TPA: hypothetical protein VGJ10_06045 [Paraburkholderia sp.]|jgi:hypothetical protein